MFTAILIDDEEPARRSLESLLTEFCPEVKIVAQASNVPDGVLAINKHKPNLVFLDIEMPDYNGFELLSFFREIDFEIIFVTAYSEYAIRAFEVSAVDYLLKPIDPEHLKNSITKYKSRIQSSNIQQRMQVLKDSFKQEDFSRIALPVADGLLFVEVKNIICLEADGSYTHVWLSDGSKLLVSKKLIFFEKVLANRKNFARVHRSHLVNFNFVSKYSKAESYLRMDNHLSIPVSKERKAEIEQQLKDIRIG